MRPEHTTKPKSTALEFFYFLYGTGATGASAQFGDTREEMIHPPSFTSEDFERLLRCALAETEASVLDEYSSVVDCISGGQRMTASGVGELFASAVGHMVKHGGDYARHRFQGRTPIKRITGKRERFA